MKYLRLLWAVLTELSGEADYRRYCAHLQRHHPGQKIPSAKEFFLTRLEEKYTRPTRCC
jgi:uncharacterized short protein YbdD (DUF466 family)